MKFLILMTLVIFAACSCKPIKYQSDEFTFISSGMANTPEYPVHINGEWCKNIKGELGGCYLRVKRDKPTIIKLLPQEYAFTLTIKCSAKIKFTAYENGVDFPKDTPVTVTITDYQAQNSFICLGRIYPQDRGEPISAFFEVRMRIKDPNYSPREAIHNTGGYQIFGKYSLYSTWHDGKEWKSGKKKTAIKTKTQYPAVSESHNMRFNYVGF